MRLQAAIVTVHGARAGTLERVSDCADFRFTFDPGWVGDPSRPVLGQVFLDRMPDAIETSGLPCWFAHLLPQGPSRRLLARWAGCADDEEEGFELLLAIGRDLPGAVVLEPGMPTVLGQGGYASVPRPPLGAPGFSLPGAQFKLSVRHGERGLVIPVWGEVGDFIAKFHDPIYPGLPRLEAATTAWARSAGIRAHATRLGNVAEFDVLPKELPIGDGVVLLAERFDRSLQGRIHCEDFGQIFDQPPGNRQYEGSYETIAAALRVLCPEDAREYVERLAFVLVSGNGDAHLKNWSVIYPDRRNPRLGPAFDLVSTVAFIPADGLALSLDGHSEFGQIRLSSFGGLARALTSDEAEVVAWVKQATARALAAWNSAETSDAFSNRERAAIDAHIARLPLCRTEPS